MRRARLHIHASLAAVLRGASILAAATGAFGVAISSAWVGIPASKPAIPMRSAPKASPISKSVGTADTEESLKSNNYVDMVRRWHKLPTRSPDLTAEGRPTLVLEMIHTNERVQLSPSQDDGGFNDAELDRASYALRDPGNDDRVPIDARVLDLAYRLQTHFDSHSVRIISAFRASSPRSNHGKGRALDLVVPGAADADVAKFAEMIGFIGVGLYPVSGFVHVDSRPRSYFWLDRSGPGQHTRAIPVLLSLAQAMDKKALARGETPPDRQVSAQLDEETSAAAGAQIKEPSAIKEPSNSPRVAE